MSSSASAEARSEAELRVITVKTEAGDPVIYSGNPAELPGVRFEMQKAMKRAGAFSLLVKHNASRLKNGIIATEDLNSIPIVTQVIPDDDVDDYTFDKPCPATAVRVTRINASRAARGLGPFPTISSIVDIPDKLLKLAIPNAHEVQIEALAYALTQLSVFEDKHHANELLVLCDYDGRKLAPLLDHIESQATPEDITLVTSRRDKFKEAGLKGLPLTFTTYRAFFKKFEVFEYKCPPPDRLKDRDLVQLIGSLFIKDPEQRKAWSDNLTQPVIFNHSGVRVSGPPVNYREAKTLAEKMLRGKAVIAELDEGSAESTALAVTDRFAAREGYEYDEEAAAALLADPRKTAPLASGAKFDGQSKAIDVPRGDDGKFLYWAPPMSLCDCGTPDGGRHIKFKWPCSYYRKPTDPPPDTGKGGGRGLGAGGRGGAGRGINADGSKGKGKGTKGGKGKQQFANISETQIAAIAAAVKAASDTASLSDAQPITSASKASDVSASSGKGDKGAGQSCMLADFEEDSGELQKLMDETSLGADLAAFFASGNKSDTLVLGGEVLSIIKQYETARSLRCDPVFARALGAELCLNTWSHQTDWLACYPSAALLERRVAEDEYGRLSVSASVSSFPAPSRGTGMILWDVRKSGALDCGFSDSYRSSGVECVEDTKGVVKCVGASSLQCSGPLIPTADCEASIDDCPDVGSGFHYAMPVMAGDNGAPSPHANSLPIFRAPIDSGCTASCTNNINLLTNVKPCDEKFKVADGKHSICTYIGDLPVLAKDASGKIFRFTFTNVRYVPDFKFTLISVSQIWRDQRVDSLFADKRVLLFPNGTRVPFDPRFRACVVTFVSEAMVSKAMTSAVPKSKESGVEKLAGVGFHNIKSVAHVARLPIAQASELLHRRCHLGVNKIRALPHVTNDAPKVLASAVPGSCVHCATAQIRRASHSSTMDSPAPEPGELHLDLKGPFPLSVTGKFRYAAFFIDEHSRFVFVDFLHDKSEVIEATKRAIAKFNATVGTPVDEKGEPKTKPAVRRLHRDHEGGLESRQFEAFRANESLHSTTSAPHDHDLNPIAESTIRVISTLATSFKSQCGAPVGFWPELIRHAVDWHNAAPQASVGSSTSDPQISPTQRFQFKQPNVMDLPAFGARTVVLKPPTHQSKTTLSPRGWVGMFLGRSSDSIGTYEVWVPSINRKVRSSSLTIDEEFFPWLGSKAHQPLVSSTATAKYMQQHLGASHNGETVSSPTEFSKPGDVNQLPRPSLSFLNLFSGPYEKHREGGLSRAIRAFGWDNITEYDNDAKLGGGWNDDILNDESYTRLLQNAHAGAFDAIVAQFPCKVHAVSRCFDASVDGGDRGPPQLYSTEFPDGLPLDQIPETHRREFLKSKRIMDRTIEVIIAARRSPRRTTLVVENPADRSIPGSNQHMLDVSHGSLFATSAFNRLCDAVPDFSMATFANCRFGADEQKYITLWYTKDAAPVLDGLNGPEHQCNHPPGTHKSIAGGRDANNVWRSEKTAKFLQQLCVKIAMALTFARTGDPTPLALRRLPASSPEEKDRNPAVEFNDFETEIGGVRLRNEPARAPPPPAPPHAPPLVDASPGSVPTPGLVIPDGTPRRLDFPSPSPTSRSSTISANPLSASSAPPSISSPADSIDLGGGVSHSPKQRPVQTAASRSVRSSTRAATEQSLLRQRLEADRRRAPRQVLDTIPESDREAEANGDAPYTSFTGTPGSSWGAPNVDSDEMEATVAGLVLESAAEFVVPDAANVTTWFDFGGPMPEDAVSLGSGKFASPASAEQVNAVIARGGIDDNTHSALLAVSAGFAVDHVTLEYCAYAHASVQFGLRADSPGAPETHGEAMARGAPWPAAIDKELTNHRGNESWEMINRSEVPRGRRLHRFVWVFKEKRDGTAKARLCVQGCTLEEGVDFDQTFAKPLRHASARGLFAYAARHKCGVRSIDFVAAYLQGQFLDGEVVYCHQPPGSNVIGSDGRPKVCKIVKPIYGIPQAGRRLQRKIFPWCKEVMGLRQLDDSDDAVFVWDDPDGKEIFAVGIYVDNMQIVHSAELNEDGVAINENSYYARFIHKLREDWDVVDEGPMSDLLAMDCERMPDGSILLHQGRYVRKLLQRFSPNGPVHKRCSVPYSNDLPRLVIEALEGSTSNDPAFPDLVKPYQQRVGALMYACAGTRPDLAYAVHQHCRCLSRPTPQLMAELEYTLSYLYDNVGIGIKFTPDDGVLHGASDASWEVRASTSGWVIYWQGAPLTWGSKKQKSVALSSCESEIVALSEAAKDVVYLRKFTRGLVPSMPKSPTVLATDNKAARDLSYNPEHHDRSKHIERRHFFIRDMVEALEIVVPLVNTKDNDADFFTKPLAPKRFKYLRRRVMNLSGDDKEICDQRSRGGVGMRGG